MVRYAIVFAMLATIVSTTTASAAYNCGRSLRAYYGLADRSLNLAKEWARKFPHTTAAPGVVVVQRRKGLDSAGHPGGHVSRIVSLLSTCRAIVSDERGQYERDICKNLIAYVNPRS